MKPLALLILLIPVTCFGQSDREVEQVDKVAYALEMDCNANKAISLGKEFLSHHKHSKEILRCLLIIGDAYQKKNIPDSALYYYNALMNSKVDKKDAYYRNYAAKCSADIFIQKKEYNKAIAYLDKAQKEYHYSSFCGNANEEGYASMALAYAKCYNGLGQYQKAIGILEPLMFPSYFTKHDDVDSALYLLYTKIYSKERIKEEFKLAEDSLVVISQQYDDGDYFIKAETQIFSKKEQFNVILETLNPDTISNKLIKQYTIDSFKQSCIYILAVR